MRLGLEGFVLYKITAYTPCIHLKVSLTKTHCSSLDHLITNDIFALPEVNDMKVTFMDI